MSTPALRSALLLTITLGLACASGSESDSGGPSQGMLADPATSAATTGGSSGADTEPPATETGDPTTTGASNATVNDTGEPGDTGEPATTDPITTGPEPPPDCGALDLCGVQCVDLVDDPNNCGKCGISCVIPHATPACAASTCAIGGCDPGWFDCDLDLQTGCEQMLAPGEQCMPVCEMGQAEICNLFDDDCNGTCDEGGIVGCRQGVHRSYSPTQGRFYTLDAAEAASGDFMVEFLNYYYLHVEPQPGLVPFYRCLKGDGRRFYTTSATCEGAGPVEGTLGHIGTEPLCGAVALYRLNGNGEHFYTTDEGERDNAINNLGYIFEGGVGFVWPTP